MNKTRVGLGCLGFVLGGAAGLLIGAVASYALAGLITSSRETQAYLVVLIVPAVALVSGLTGAATLAWLATRSGPLLALSAPGWLLMMAVLALGLSWSKSSRPGSVSVRNATTIPFENVYLGSDFRRNTRIGDLAPGQTSSPVNVDLDNPATFNGLEGRAGDGYVRHQLSKEESAAVSDGAHVWVVGEADGALTYELVAAP